MCLCCEAEDYGCSLLTKLALTNTLVYKYGGLWLQKTNLQAAKYANAARGFKTQIHKPVGRITVIMSIFYIQSFVVNG